MPWYSLKRMTVPFAVLLLTITAYSRLNGAADQQSSSTVQTSTDSQSTPVLRANTRLVVVDVVATNGKGESIPDLKASDFVMLEDSQVQKISGFSFHQGKATVVAQATLPPNIVTNVPQVQASSLNIILFDAVNGDFTEHAYARDELLKFFNSTPLDRPVALFSLQNDLKLLHDFTTDNKALSAVLTKYRPPAQTAGIESVESRASAFTTAGAYHTSERGIETTLNELNKLAKILKGYPGRKNLIWLSESFPFTLFPESNSQLNQDGQSLRSSESSNGGPSSIQNLQTASPYKTYAALVKKVADALMAAQVAVYVVDAGAVSKDDHLASQHTMNILAESTGGKAFKNSNNLALGLKTSVEDGSIYYTLEYYPENRKWDGQFRAIQVKSSRPGVSLRYRQGYYALDPDKISKDETDSVAENFSRLLELDAPSVTGVLFQAQVVAPPDKNKKVLVTFHVDPQSIAFEHKDDGKEYAKVMCTVWAYGKDKDKPAMFSGTVNANLPANEYQLMMKQHFMPCSRELELKPGTYTLRMGVLDRTTNKIGTASTRVTVP
ncbi:MAG TPA: VWA domain-containing protein [Candidatus Angelobacter sp.]|nr:VWA domain-containing protein [Candidatus Angelobacter sp.]